jgi:hypothetical protein
LTRWGTSAVVYAGQGNRDHLRTAVQIRSKEVSRRTVYSATGWVEVEGRWIYIHGDGAIGSEGPVDYVSVDLPEALSRYRLPPPPSGEELAGAIRASIDLARDLGPDAIILPLMMTALRAVLPDAHFATHICGQTGTFKTETASLVQRCFGAKMDPKNLPANWSSTENALESVASAARHALIVVDDFAPSGSTADINRYHRTADRLFRSQGNQSARQRLRADGSMRAERPPRGIILSTGEEVPKGHSIRARLLVVQVSRGDINVGRLGECQRDAAAGLYAACLAGYIRWLAGRFEEARLQVKAEAARIRDELLSSAGPRTHLRTPTLMGDLLAGLDLFLRFALEAEAIGDEFAAALGERSRAALLALASEQSSHQEAVEPTQRYLDLLGSVLSSGRGHLASLDGNQPTTAPRVWGWRPVDNPLDYECRWSPQGSRIGWVEAEYVFLDGNAAFAEVQRLAESQGEPLPVGVNTLHRRLKENGLLARSDEQRDRVKVRVTIEGVCRPVLHLRTQTLAHLYETGQTGQTGQREPF